MSTTSNSLQFQTKTNTNRPGKKKKIGQTLRTFILHET